MTKKAPPRKKESYVSVLRAVARRLDYMIGQVALDEFAWQDANYDRDLALGRELLFLIANDGWIRSTSEIIDISRSDAVETAIDIDIDLSRITHEAFRGWSGQIWLPIVVLPPLEQQLPDTEQQQPDTESFSAEPFSTLTVTDAAGTLLMTLPRADVRHRLAAALTEIIVNVVTTRQSDVGDQGFAANRDHRLVLSAAIYRLLRHEIVPALLLYSDDPMRERPSEPMGRMDRARDEVGNVLTKFADLLTEPDPPADAGTAAVRQLTERAILVLNALTKSAVIVISADRDQPPTVLTVRLPGRALHLGFTRWADIFRPDRLHRRWTGSRRWRRWLRIVNWIFPSASLHLDLLLPSADADRQVRVNLPAGISPDPTLVLVRRAQLDVRCQRPFPIKQLATATDQLVGADAGWPVPLRQSLADLALAKASAVAATLRDYRVGADPAQEAFGPTRARDETRVFRDKLTTLTSALRGVATQRGNGDAARGALTGAWADRSWLSWPMQRRTSTDTISPGVVAARARVIDDPAQRSTVTSARMEVRIAVTDSAYFSAALLTGWINILLMLVVLLFFSLAHKQGLAGQQVSAEVLAFVLTLFSAIQLGRIERSDRSAVRGVLVPSGNPLIVAAILPTVLFAVAVAFSHLLTWIMRWAGICLALQLFELCLMWGIQYIGLRRGDRSGDRQPRHEADLLFYTDAPDYSHGTVLHSTWWRSTTAEALMMDRPADGYLIWQHRGQQELSSLLHRPVGKPSFRLSAPWLHRHSRADTDRRPALGDEPGEPVGEEPKSPLGQANVLALLRSGPSAQSLNFVVFRDQVDLQPGVVPGDIVRVRLDPSLLTLAEDATSVISVFLGVLGEAKVARHPITVALHLAAAHGLVVREVQLPIRAPDVHHADLIWGRVQLDVRPRELDRIAVFMSDLMALPTAAAVGIQSRADGMPRINRPQPQPAGPAEPAAASQLADHTCLVLATHLDVVAQSGVRHDDSVIANWRLMAICANWRVGIESQMLAGLDPDLVLVGLTAAILYGRSVLLLLCRGTGEQASGDDAEQDQAVIFDRWQSRRELGTASSHPLLRVHMRTPDRPGATVAVLRSLRAAIEHKLPQVFSRSGWNVWYARVVVRDGNMAHMQLTIVLPIDQGSGLSQVGEWGPEEFSEIEHQTLERLADGQHHPEFAGTAAETPPNTVIRIGLVRMHDLNWAQSQAASQETSAQPSPGDTPVTTSPTPGRWLLRRR